MRRVDMLNKINRNMRCIEIGVIPEPYITYFD